MCVHGGRWMGQKARREMHTRMLDRCAAKKNGEMGQWGNRVWHGVWGVRTEISRGSRQASRS